ncbi:hypothetical protein NHE_0608 [Neorickettsia helminthoeca str. Oregon]|uniref:Uncharacterized protein n=1 Tax=Neorickettsia helminthoeca str. Oregon TaxID=1286528 RepID=X5H4E6_9RICK|nr:hypothetical protein [Neorickettsia helminthoeca]AHX11543.1 hypothetical protein NHE_0608 [Neorickettsia helminthoeca str. Oregon]
MFEEYRQVAESARVVLSYLENPEIMAGLLAAFAEQDCIPESDVSHIRDVLSGFAEMLDRAATQGRGREDLVMSAPELQGLRDLLLSVFEPLRRSAYGDELASSDTSSSASASSPRMGPAKCGLGGFKASVRKRKVLGASSSTSMLDGDLLLPPFPETPVKVVCAHKLLFELSLLLRSIEIPTDERGEGIVEHKSGKIRSAAEIVQRARRCAALLSAYSVVRSIKANAGAACASLGTIVKCIGEQVGSTFPQASMAALEDIASSVPDDEERALVQRIIQACREGNFPLAREQAANVCAPQIRAGVFKCIEDGEKGRRCLVSVLEELQVLVPATSAVMKSIASTGEGGEVVGLSPTLTKFLKEVGEVVPKAVMVMKSIASTGEGGEVVGLSPTLTEFVARLRELLLHVARTDESGQEQGLVPEVVKTLPSVREALSRFSELTNGLVTTDENGQDKCLKHKVETIIGDAGASVRSIDMHMTGLMHNAYEVFGTNNTMEEILVCSQRLYGALCRASNTTDGKKRANVARAIRTLYNELRDCQLAFPATIAIASSKLWARLACRKVLEDEGCDVRGLSSAEIINLSLKRDFVRLFGGGPRTREIGTLKSVSELLELLGKNDEDTAYTDRVIEKACEEVEAFARSAAVLKEKYFNRMSELVGGALNASVGAGTVMRGIKGIVSPKNICRALVVIGFLFAAFSCSGISEFKNFKAIGIASFISLCVGIGFLSMAFTKVQGFRPARGRDKDKYSIYHGIFCILLPALAFSVAAIISLLRLFGDDIIKVRDFWVSGSSEGLCITVGIAVSFISTVLLYFVDIDETKRPNLCPDTDKEAGMPLSSGLRHVNLSDTCSASVSLV